MHTTTQTPHNRLTPLLVLTLSLLILNPATTALAQSNQPPEHLPQELAAQFRAALSTNDTADNLTLARQLIDQLPTHSQHTETLTAIAIAAHRLATLAADHTLALSAADQLLAYTHSESDAADALLLAVESRRNLYRAASTPSSTEDRALAAQELTAALLDAGNTLEAAARDAEALRLFTEAVQIATANRSPNLADLRDRQREAALRQRITQQAEALEQKLASDPSAIDAPDTAQRIARLYIITLDQPTKALPHIDLLEDQDWHTNITLAAQPVNQLTDPQSTLQLARWYEQHLRSAPAAARPALLRRTHRLYDRITLIHLTQDQLRSDAQQGRDRIQQLLADSGLPAPPPPRTPINTTARNQNPAGDEPAVSQKLYEALSNIENAPTTPTPPPNNQP